MPRIFISYRRNDTASVVGRLYDHLSREFGEDSVFRDIYSISPGSDFEQAIENTLARCEVSLVVIGSRWQAPDPATGRCRLDDPQDFVRREIETALSLGSRVIPVLVEGATLPAEQTVSESLRPLLRRQAVELTDSRWEYDIQRLVDGLFQPEEVFPDARSSGRPARGGSTHRALVSRALVAANLAALVELWLELTVPLATWSAMGAWALGNLPAIIGIATALAAVALFVTRGGLERPSQGAMRVLRRVHTWSERRSTRPLLAGTLVALSLALWAVPPGIRIKERSGPVAADFCSRFFADSRMQSERIQQCQGDRNVGSCGASAFSCQYYEVEVFTGLVPAPFKEVTVTISGTQEDGAPASVVWADGALERVTDKGWTFSWGVDLRELKVGAPAARVPRMFTILGTRQHDKDTPLSNAKVGVSVSTDTGSTPFEESEDFTVRKQ